MLSPALLVLVLVSAQDAPPPPPAEVTSTRVQTMEKRLQRIQILADELRKVSAPLKSKDPTQSNTEYTTQAEFLLKARAELLIQLRDLTQAGLEAKYELEATLDEYNRWFSDKEKDDQQRVTRRKARLEELQDQVGTLSNEARFVADLIAFRVNERIAELTRQDKGLNAQEIKTLEEEHARIRANVPEEERFNDKASLTRKYESFELPRLREVLAKLAERAELADFELRFIDRNVMARYQEQLNNLDPPERKSLEQANQLIKQCRNLEMQAQQIAIASRYTREMIEETQRNRDIRDRVAALQRRVGDEATITNALGVIVGGDRLNTSGYGWLNRKPATPPIPSPPTPVDSQDR